MDECVGVWVNGQMNSCMHGQIDRKMTASTDAWMDEKYSFTTTLSTIATCLNRCSCWLSEKIKLDGVEVRHGGEV